MDPLTTLATLSSLATLISSGTSLAHLLFSVSNSVGTCNNELRDLGIDISLFCAVLRQIQSALDASSVHANRRVSDTATRTTQEILDRCRDIFDKIDEIVRWCGIDASRVLERSETIDDREPEDLGINLCARVRWITKRSKVAVYKANLESFKVTLVLMVGTLMYAEQVANRRQSSAATEVEDINAEMMAQTLTVAQWQTRIKLRELEEQAIQNDQAVRARRSSTPDSFAREMPEGEPGSEFMDRLLDLSPRSGSMEMEEMGNESVEREFKQVRFLLAKFTNQSDHWDELQAASWSQELPQRLDSLAISPGTSRANTDK